jgi:hypothetical protein
MKELDKEKINENITELSEHFAASFGALADLFAEWRKPEVARRVVDSLIGGNRQAFQKLLRVNGPPPDPVNPPPPLLPTGWNFCTIVIGLIEVLTPRKRVDCYRLRPDLTDAEWTMFRSILLYCARHGIPVPDGVPPRGFHVIEDVIVPAGEFLNLLIAAGLVEFGSFCFVDGALELQITSPERFCTGLP